jgi:hypothetical protein
MAKALIKIGYTEYVIAAEDAMPIIHILASAERYEKMSHRVEDSRDYTYTHHVWTDADNNFSLEYISDELYQVAKMAGKRPRD